MMKNIRKRLENEKGLTLVELLAVIVILAIIAAIAIPAIGNIIKNSQVGALKSDSLNAIAAAELYIIDNPEVLENNTSSMVTLSLLTGDEEGAGESYLEEEISLTDFEYDPTAKAVTKLKAQKGGVKFELIGGQKAVKKDLLDLPNNSKSTTIFEITR
ncbi:prepilin-type N-terminal cleavage/methylation domain-containing protein [Sporosarcina pasteurii]|nr:prepilin-type N-terminal cleavage/methylation domain-containing protein [Sporosarcina pasteurii]MDS9471335.1 prepilin-type N-terminal cleavage/methylation domain-containing protein [Sporosarcina pasteurii]QBQ07058.1 prepilin-type N-terminal cleavage/methylation domain-containing protein [Sporosarcina pasteurii]